MSNQSKYGNLAEIAVVDLLIKIIGSHGILINLIQNKKLSSLIKSKIDYPKEYLNVMSGYLCVVKTFISSYIELNNITIITIVCQPDNVSKRNDLRDIVIIAKYNNGVDKVFGLQVKHNNDNLRSLRFSRNTDILCKLTNGYSYDGNPTKVFNLIRHIVGKKSFSVVDKTGSILFNLINNIHIDFKNAIDKIKSNDRYLEEFIKFCIGSGKDYFVIGRGKKEHYINSMSNGVGCIEKIEYLNEKKITKKDVVKNRNRIYIHFTNGMVISFRFHSDGKIQYNLKMEVKIEEHPAGNYVGFCLDEQRGELWLENLKDEFRKRDFLAIGSPEYEWEHFRHWGLKMKKFITVKGSTLMRKETNEE